MDFITKSAWQDRRALWAASRTKIPVWVDRKEKFLLSIQFA